MTGVSHHITDAYGVTHIAPAPAGIRSLLATLDADDASEEEVSLVHESGWVLTAFQSGTVTFENLSQSPEVRLRFIRDVSRGKMLDWLLLLAQGRLETLQALPWQREA